MKKSKMLFLLMVILLVGSMSAFASSSGTLTLNSVSPGSNISPGIDGYTYPYYFTLNVNSVQSSVALMCDDAMDDVNFNETWNVNIYTMTDIITSENSNAEVGQMSYQNGSAGITGNGVLNGLDAEQRAYADAAYIFLNGGLVNGPSNADVIANEAVWEVFALNGVSPNPFASDQTQINVLLNAANSFTNTLTQAAAEADFSSIRFYTPTCVPAGSANCGQTGPNAPYSSRPQEYIGTVPEPGTLALLTAGLIGLGLTVRRKGVRFTNL